MTTVFMVILVTRKTGKEPIQLIDKLRHRVTYTFPVRLQRSVKIWSEDHHHDETNIFFG